MRAQPLAFLSCSHPQESRLHRPWCFTLPTQFQTAMHFFAVLGGILNTYVGMALSNNTTTTMFDIVSIPRRGNGLVFLIPNLPSTFVEPLVASKFKALCRDQQRQFLALHNNFPGTPYPFSGIVKTNSLPCGSGAEIGGVYPTMTAGLWWGCFEKSIAALCRACWAGPFMMRSRFVPRMVERREPRCLPSGLFGRGLCVRASSARKPGG